MPLIPDQQQPFGFSPQALPDTYSATPEMGQATEPGPSFGQTLGASFALENEVLGAIKSIDSESNFGDWDSEHNPWNTIRGTDLEPYHEAFIGSRNQKETDHLATVIRKEIENRKILERSNPALAFATSGIASLASPTTLLPGGAVFKGFKAAKAGVAAAKSALLVGAANAGAAAVQEGLLHSQQYTRTGTESAYAVGGSFLLGAILGGSISGISSAKFTSLTKKLEGDLNIGPRIDEAIAQKMAQAEASGAPVGAASPRGPSAELAPAFGLEKTIVKADPMGRTLNSPFAELRELETQLVEVPMQLTRNEQGFTTAPRGGSAETRMKTQGTALEGQAVQGVQQLYAQYRFGDPDAKMVGFKSLMKPDKTKLTEKGFREEVGKAMARGDEHEIPEVAAAAKHVRKTLIDPLAEKAVQMKLLDADVVKKARPQPAATVADAPAAPEVPKADPVLRSNVDSLLSQVEKMTGQKMDSAVRERMLDTIAANQDLLSRLREIATGEADVPFALKGPIGRHLDDVVADLEDGFPVKIDEAVTSHMDRALSDVRVGLSDAARDVPMHYLASVEPMGEDVVMSFNRLGGGVENITMTLSTFRQARAFTRGGDVFFVRTGIVDDINKVLVGEIHHELVHALANRGSVDPAVLARLSAHADALGLLNMSLKDFLTRINHPDAGRVARVEPLSVSYSRAYGQQGYTGEALTKRVQGEALAHMAELRAHGAISPEALGPVAEDLDALLGPVGGVGAAQRKAVQEWAADVGARIGDDGSVEFALGPSSQDSLGYTSKALEAAKSLKQLKGTPEQMRAQLRSAGVKEAELEATGLDNLLAETTAHNAPNWDKWGVKLGDKKVLDGDEIMQDFLRPDGSRAGAINYQVKPDAIYITGLLGDRRGTGKGQASRAVKAIIDYAVQDGKSVIATATEGARPFWNIMGFRHDGINSVLDAEQIAKLRSGEINSTIWGHERGYGDAFEKTYGPPASSLGTKAGRKSITKDEIISYLEQNRVGVREVKYGGSDMAENLGANLIYMRDHLRPEHEHLRNQVENGIAAVEVRGPLRGYDYLSSDVADVLDEYNLPTNKPTDVSGPTKWSSYSLDPNNPTYRETVLHLPGQQISYEKWLSNQASWGRDHADTPEMRSKYDALISDGKLLDNEKNFQQHHFASDPNVVAHLMTSVNKHEGKSVFTLDQIQSDWGQKLRDGGVRDEGKIAELNSSIDAQSAKMKENFIAAAKKVGDKVPEHADDMTLRQTIGPLANKLGADDPLRQTLIDGVNDLGRLKAELRTAEASSPGHPLVNTTDQWTSVALKRAIRQAVEQDAEYISIPSGKTVESYNPQGDSAGNAVFYDQIVPKNLRNILRKIDKESPDGVRVEKLETPTPLKRDDIRPSEEAAAPFKDEWDMLNVRIREARDRLDQARYEMSTSYASIMDEVRTLEKAREDLHSKMVDREMETNPRGTLKGNGFTVFKLTDKVKKSVLEEGQPLFAMRSSDLDMSPEARKARAEKMGFDTSRVWYHGTGDGPRWSAPEDADGNIVLAQKPPFESFNNERIGSKNDAGHYGRGHYFASTPGEASYYGPSVSSYYLRGKLLDLGNNTGDYTFRGHFKSFAPKLDAIGALEDAQKQAFKAIGDAERYVDENVTYIRAQGFDGKEGWQARVDNPVTGYSDKIMTRGRLREGFPQTKEEALSDLKEEFISEMERFHPDQYPGLGTETASLSDYIRVDSRLGSQGLTDKAKAAGYDGIVYGDEAVVFDPSNIRSVNAAFDPSKEGSANLLYALRDLSKRLDAPLIDDLKKSDQHPGRVMAIHGTRAPENFDKFDPGKSSDFGIHFGTSEQADVPAGMATSRDNARMIPVVLDLKTVVDVPDLMNWPPIEVAQAVEKNYPTAFGLTKRIQDVIDAGSKEVGVNGKLRPTKEALDAGKEELRRLLSNANIDGLRYWNGAEGDGWSYIVWDQGKVTSALTGQPMMALRDNNGDVLKKIRSLGGIKDEGGELANMGVGDDTRGIINNQTGLDPDKMREALVQAGYLPDTEFMGQSQSTIQDLYDLIGESIRAPKENVAHREELAYQVIGAAKTLMHENGLELKLTPEQEDQLVSFVLDQRMQVDDALERVGMAGEEPKSDGRPQYTNINRDVNARRFMNEMNERAAEAGLGGDGGDTFNPKIADEIWNDGKQTYVHRVYDRERIVRKRPQFKAIITDYFEGAQQRAKVVLRRIEREVEQATQKAMSEGKTVKIPKETEKNLTDLQEFTSLSQQELASTADIVIDHILGAAEGRMQFELPNAVRGPLKARVLRIADTFESASGKFEDFLDRDIGTIIRRYTQSMVPDIELTRMFGSLNMEDQIAKVNDEFRRMASSPELDKLPQEKAEAIRAKLNRQREKGIKDLLAQVDRLRGTYKLPEDPMAFGPRAIRAVKQFNLLRMLGGMTISALPDIFRPMMVHGVTSYFKDGLRPFLGGLRAIKLSAEETRLAGTAWDMVLSSRMHSIADVTDNYGKYSWFERGLGWGQEKFGSLTMMNQWNTALKSWAGMITQNNIIRMCQKVADGSATAKEMEKLAAASIDGWDARLIAEQFSKHGVVQDGVYLANTRAWDVSSANIRNALDSFRGAVVRDVDRIVVTPGQDKPLFFSDPMGSIVGQFKSFSFASVPRTLVAGLQQRDAGFMMGMLSSIAMGMAVEYFKSKTNDKPLPKTDAQWVAAGIDRAGLLGWLSDANNIVEKFSGGTVGIGPATGKPLSRYASRNFVDAFLGPTLGTATDVGLATSGFFRAALGGEDLRQSDISALRRLIPLQNLFYLSYIFQKLEQATGDALGAKPKSRSPSVRDRMSSNDAWLDEFISA